MRHGWAGKRLYTNAAGGRITNRFFPSFTEQPGFDAFARATTTTPGVQALNLYPYGNGQSREGLIFRGRSSVDGRDVILMDWRGLKAWPANGMTAEHLTNIHALMQTARGAGLEFVPEVLATRAGPSVVEYVGRLWDLTRLMPGAAEVHQLPDRVVLVGVRHRDVGISRCDRRIADFRQPAQCQD